MKIKALQPDGSNNGKLKFRTGTLSTTNGDVVTHSKTEFDLIEIKKGRYIQSGISHPLVSEKENYFQRMYCFDHENKNIYYLNSFGKIDSNHGIHIALTWFETQKFLWLQNKHWLQKEESIRYVVNVMFLILAAYISLKKL